MTVSGTPLSPSFGTQEGSGRAVEHLWRESPPHPPRNGDTPHTSGYDGMGTMLILTRRPAGQQFCGCHSHGFRMVCPRCDSLGKESPRSLCFILPTTLRYVRHLHVLRQENAVYAVTMIVYSLCPCTRRGSCFLPCKGTSYQLDGIGFHSEHIGNLPFRAGFESVFPTSSAQTFRMPCG